MEGGFSLISASLLNLLPIHNSAVSGQMMLRAVVAAGPLGYLVVMKAGSQTAVVNLDEAAVTAAGIGARFAGGLVEVAGADHKLVNLVAASHAGKQSQIGVAGQSVGLGGVVVDELCFGLGPGRVVHAEE